MTRGRPSLFPFLACLAAACGAHPTGTVTTISETFNLVSPAQKMRCPTMPTTGLLVRLSVGTTYTCPLAMSPPDGNGDVAVTGDCMNVPNDGSNLTIDWYVVGKNSAHEVVLAELTASGSALKGQVGDVSASAVSDPVIARPASTSPAATKDKFNCDRTGTNVCDSTNPAPSVSTDADTCSNLEEWCKGTLFMNSTDQCP